LERNTDRDAFSFILGETQSGASLTVTGIGIGSGQNLDAVLEIQDASGQIVFVDDPADSYNASISAPLLPGKYTAIVRSNGEYGRVGQYTLSGHIDESTSVVNGFSRVAPLGSTAMATTVDGALDYPDDTDTFVVLGQAGQVLSVIVTPTNPLAVLEANLSSIAEPVASRGPGQPIVIANQLLDGTDLSLDISGTSVGDYTVEFGVNQSFEVTASGIRGSDSRDPATIGQSFSNGTSLWNVSGVSGDGTDTRTSLVPLGATWTYLDDGSNQQKEWRLADFDDSTWQSGAGQFGYGEGDENVRLQQDRITGSRIRTFYFRHEFYVDDASAIRDLTLKLLRDDGAAVYLNGTEVRRDNLVANASFTTFASTAVVEDRFLDSTVDPKLLVDGRNVLAVEVHQASNTSDDLSFALELIANAIPQRASTELIAKQSTWSYLDDGSDQREAWREPEFDDASWAHGAGKLGYGDGDERTRLSSTANGVPTRTFYFRRDFFVADVGAIDELVANINYDDGLAVYVNGIEVARSNLARNAEHQTLADESKTPEGTFDPFVIDPLFLNEGTNTIAVEVHQHDDASSDVSFDLELIAYNAALEVDEYEFDVPVELIGSTIDVALVADQMFAGETLVLFTPTGDLATAKTGSGDAALAISDFLIKEPGTYRLQLLSDVKGDYQITIVSDAVATYMFDELPPLPTADRLVGFLPFGESDVYKFEATAGEHTLSVDFPFDTPDRSTENDLQVSILVFRPDGTILTASNDGTLNVTLEAATYQVEVLAISGSGEYHFTVAGPPAIFASDLNGDGVTTADDIDYLCEAVRSDNRLLDQNGDGQIDFLDVEHFVTKPLGTTFGDANLDGVFNSTDFVAVFDVAEYEDDIDGNSTWAEGDWNCSGDFDTADLVTAFTYAGYSAAASPRTSPVNRDLVAARTLESHDRESDDSNKATTPHQARSVWNVSAKVLQPKSVDAVFLA
ncbi:MAG: hypothetical protein KDB27_34965, partial [Planctomycetales bacterium]|nr:hypothetical protein [Planctomycetales bacterium]